MPDQGGADVVEHAGCAGGAPGNLNFKLKRFQSRTRVNTPPGSSRSYHENFDFTWGVFVAIHNPPRGRSISALLKFREASLRGCLKRSYPQEDNEGNDQSR